MSSKSLFGGGVHPNDGKTFTASKPIEVLPLPEKVYIPLRQHIGAEASPIVKVNDLVKKGQLIAEVKGFVSANVHASISGKVVSIGEFAHPGSGRATCIEIENDGNDEWAEGLPLNRDWNAMNTEQLTNAILAGGVVGMGGATFPAHVKLSPPKDKTIDTFILNGAECEPYLTADYRLLIEQGQDVITGMKIVIKMLNIKKACIGIEDNKPEAVAKMKEHCAGTNIEVIALPTKYPQGAEKMLIKAITGREVPSGKLPADVGAVVHNVATMKAVYDAVVKGIPLIERVCTVSGSAIKTPKNVLFRIGTTFQYMIDQCGGYSETPGKILAGGPMMGFAQPTAEVPAIKGSGGILALSKKETQFFEESNCIRCGRCVEACPMGLVPSMLSILGERKFYKDAKEEYNLLDCMECGSCVYVCPAKRNIVQYIRYMKNMNVTFK